MERLDLNLKLETTPRVSILTATHNRIDFLEKLISSLEHQSYKNFEWVVADDGSQDGTLKYLLNRCEKCFFTTKIISSDVRIGKAKMDNLLFDNADGDFFIACDSDDYFNPSSIFDLVNLYYEGFERAADKSNYAGVIAQNIDTQGISQTFYSQDVPKENMLIQYKNFNFKGDGSIFYPSSLVKGKRFLEVDFLITESSFWEEILSDKVFYISPNIVKTMDRTAENSVSFGNKLRYCRGSLYSIVYSIKRSKFRNFPISKKFFVVLNYWRYSIHGDMPLKMARKLWEVTDRYFMYLLIYPFSLMLCFLDRRRKKIEKTHIEFNKNIRSFKINKFIIKP